MKLSENTSVSMPIRNMAMIIAGVIAGVFCIHRTYWKTNIIRDIKRTIPG